MRTNLRTVFAMIGVVIGSSAAAAAAAAESADATQPRCPAGYWRMDTLCFNQSTGDVVLAAPPAPSDEVRAPRAQ
jgi:type IV secretory pathway protease TraF